MQGIMPELLIVIAVIVALCGPSMTVWLANGARGIVKHYRQAQEHHRVGR